MGAGLGIKLRFWRNIGINLGVRIVFWCFFGVFCVFCVVFCGFYMFLCDSSWVWSGALFFVMVAGGVWLCTISLGLVLVKILLFLLKWQNMEISGDWGCLLLFIRDFHEFLRIFEYLNCKKYEPRF